MEAEKAKSPSFKERIKTNFAIIITIIFAKGESTRNQWMKLLSLDWVLCVCGSCNYIKKVPSDYNRDPASMHFF